MIDFKATFREFTYLLDCQNINCKNLKETTSIEGKVIKDFIFNKDSKSKLILVIGGGMSAEREISFMTSAGVTNALKELGYQVVFADMGADIASVVNGIKPDLVYIALHGTYGEDGCIQGMLNFMQIPYTGPGVLPSSVAFNKKKSEEILRANGIKIAESIIVKKSMSLTQDPMERPYVIKPLSQGSSVGVEVIFPEDDFNFADYQFKYGDEIIVERYLKGREIQVAILDGKALGVLEIKIKSGKRFYDYEVKYTEGLAEHLMPAPLNEDAYNNVLKLSEEVCEIFEGTNGLLRAEFIYVPEENVFYMLELNTLPGMTKMSICPEIAEYIGISYNQLVEKIVKKANFES